MWLLACHRYRAGWISSGLSQFGWAWVAIESELWGMLLFSVLMLGVAVQGVRKRPMIGDR